MSDEGKLFIGELSFKTNEETLHTAFGKYGTIEKESPPPFVHTGEPRTAQQARAPAAFDASAASAQADSQELTPFTNVPPVPASSQPSLVSGTKKDPPTEMAMAPY